MFESYGFAPRNAVDGDRMREAVEAGGSREAIIDIREETMMDRAATDEGERETRNIAQEHSEIISELSKLWTGWSQK